jgi:hypothetical protein
MQHPSQNKKRRGEKNQSFWISGQLSGASTVVVATDDFSSHHNI